AVRIEVEGCVGRGGHGVRNGSRDERRSTALRGAAPQAGARDVRWTRCALSHAPGQSAGRFSPSAAGVTGGTGTAALNACAKLKARLPAEPRHPRAVETLCEAVALWCGRKVLAALAADNPD